jgi:galactokinase
MLRAWNNWYHIMFSTYGQWLPGDERGWRTRHHRDHIEGDYNRRVYSRRADGLYGASRLSMSHPPVVLLPDERRTIGFLALESLAIQDIEVLALGVSIAHVHMLARCAGVGLQTGGTSFSVLNGSVDGAALTQGRYALGVAGSAFHFFSARATLSRMPLSSATASLKKKLAGPFRAVINPREPFAVATAPGRVDVLGGLAVEAGGTLAQMAVPRRAAACVQLRNDPQLVLCGLDIAPPIGDPQLVIPLAEYFRQTPSGPQLAPARELASKVAGPLSWAAPLLALWYVLQQSPASSAMRNAGLPRGFTVALHSEIPLGAGQASSTALLAATLGALSEAAGFKLETLDAALLIQRAENLFAASSGHVVDALTCLTADAAATGVRPASPRVLRFSAQPHTLVSQTALPADLRVMALDTGVRYTAAGPTVSAIRLAGAMGLRIIETIYRDLGQRHTPLHGYLANLSPSLYRQYFRALMPKRLRGADFVRTYGPLPDRAGVIDSKKLYRVRAAVDHLVTENEFAENFLQAVEELSDPVTAKAMTRREKILAQRRAGRLLLASHHSYNLRLEISCREADWLVDHLMESGPEKGVFGARITGTGGGGTVVCLLNRSSAANDALLDTMNAYNKLAGVQLSVCEAGTTGAKKHA